MAGYYDRDRPSVGNRYNRGSGGRPMEGGARVNNNNHNRSLGQDARPRRNFRHGDSFDDARLGSKKPVQRNQDFSFSKSDLTDKWTHDLFDKQRPSRRDLEAPFLSSKNNGKRRGSYERQVTVSNLHWKVTESDLKELFQEYQCEKVTVKYDHTDRSTGEATLFFNSVENAKASIERYDNVELDGQPMKLELSEPQVGGRYDPGSNPGDRYTSREPDSWRRGNNRGNRRYDDRPYSRNAGPNSRPRRGGRNGYLRGEVDRSFKSGGGRDREDVTVDKLDKEMDEYMQKLEKGKSDADETPIANNDMEDRAILEEPISQEGIQDASTPVASDVQANEPAAEPMALD